MFGLVSPSSPGPRDEKLAISPSGPNAPVAYVARFAPGDDVDWQPASPALPAAQAPKMPAASQASISSDMKSSIRPGCTWPHELLTMCGRCAGSGSEPSVRVGARIHCPEASRSASEQLAQPLAAIQSASGATPIWLPSPSSPTMVPMTCVPCASTSQGAPSQEPPASNQL